jgi:hypothetical protein
MAAGFYRRRIPRGRAPGTAAEEHLLSAMTTPVGSRYAAKRRRDLVGIRVPCLRRVDQLRRNQNVIPEAVSLLPASSP